MDSPQSEFASILPPDRSLNTATPQPSTGLSRSQGSAIVALLAMSVLLVAGALFSSGLNLLPAKFEYKTVAFQSEGRNRSGSEAQLFSTVTPDDATLASIGIDGWEIVSSYLEMETAFPNFGSSLYVTGLQPNVRPQRLVLLLKRRKR